MLGDTSVSYGCLYGMYVDALYTLRQNCAGVKTHEKLLFNVYGHVAYVKL